MTIYIERIYEIAEASMARHFLVDRLWPRGIKKQDLQATAWSKDVAPSNELRKWFNHDPKKWDVFQRRYFEELDAKPESWTEILQAAKKGSVVLLYGAKDKEHNQAVALKTYLERKMQQQAKQVKR